MKILIARIASIVILILVHAAAARGATYYVSPSGGNSNPGIRQARSRRFRPA